MDAGIEAFIAVDHPGIAIPDGSGFHIGGVRAMIGFRQSKADTSAAGDQGRQKFLLLGSRAEFPHHVNQGEIADN